MPSEEDKTEEEKTPTQTEDEEDEDGDSELAKAGKSFRRKLKNETHYTSGLGKTKTKQKILEEFNNLVVPELEKIGWKKVS